MTRKFLGAATLVAMMATSCSQDKLGQNESGDDKLTKVSFTTGNFGTRSAGPLTKNEQNAYFNPNETVTVIAYAGATELKSFTADFDTEVASTPDYQRYAAEVLLPSNATHVDLVLNENDVTNTEDANTRQGSTSELAANVAKVRISKTTIDDDTNGLIKSSAGGGYEATLSLRPDMARIELVNEDLASDLDFTNYLASTKDIEIVADGATTGTSVNLDYEFILSQYANLEVTGYYLDNVMLTADGTLTDHNATYESSADANWRLKWLGEYADGGASENMDDVLAPYVITGATGAITPGNLAAAFGTYELAAGSTATATSIGYNVFPTATPNDVNDAKLTKHPHFIIQVTYNPATFSIPAGVTNPSQADVVVNAPGAEVTKYINFAAYTVGSTPVTFEGGNVFQFDFKSVIDALIEGNVTDNPDSKDKNVSVEVRVLDWEVTEVTPLPL